jgi:alpha-beta hydrolase superfamily lysophospholipase
MGCGKYFSASALLAATAGRVFAQKRVIHNVWCALPAKAISSAQLSVANAPTIGLASFARASSRRRRTRKSFSARARIAPVINIWPN